MIQHARMFTSVVMCLFTLSLVAGCGGGGEEETSGPMTPTSSGSDTKSADADSKTSESKSSEKESSESEESPKTTAGGGGVGYVVGTIKLTGEVPTLKPLVKKGDESAKDPEVCAKEGVPDQTLVVGEGNGIANVFIYLRKAPDGAPEVPVPQEPVVFDQQGCKFVPHAFVMHINQKIKAVSSDGVSHNLHTHPVKNPAFNQIISPNNKAGEMIEYEVAEILPVKVTCDIHPWMSAWHFPLDHTYATVTDAEGNFKIENLPAGKHEFRIWHEKDGTGGYLEKNYEVTVKAGEATEVNLEYTAADLGH